MNLFFMQKFPWGEETNFSSLIPSGIKTTTIREDPKNRWRAGMDAHCRSGSRFKSVLFYLAPVVAVKHIILIPESMSVYISGQELSYLDKLELALHDGFRDTEQFWQYFNKPLAGKILHFGDGVIV
jgi:uncharacterized protein YqfB (UPF0267 family)